MGGDGGRTGSASMEGVDDRVSGRGSESGIRACTGTWQEESAVRRKPQGEGEQEAGRNLELDDLSDGEEIELGAKKADQAISFEHQFEPERSEPRTAF